MRLNKTKRQRQGGLAKRFRGTLWAAAVSVALLPLAEAQTSPTPIPSAEDHASAEPESMFPHFKDTRFWLSGQINFIFQAHPDFHAPYSGPNSLSPRYETATSRVMTLYTGVRLNDSTEILVDIGEARGMVPRRAPGRRLPPDLCLSRHPQLT